MLVPIKAKESELYFYAGPSEADTQKMKKAVRKTSQNGKEMLRSWWYKMKAKLLPSQTPKYS
ncbi:MAG: hypothetical protein U0U67_12385 [Chitinophagales bacterium]